MVCGSRYAFWFFGVIFLYNVGEFCSVIIRRYMLKFYPDSFSLTAVATVKLKLSYEINFAGNHLADHSIRLSAKHPFPKIYLDVNVSQSWSRFSIGFSNCRYKFPTPCMREIAHICWTINVYVYFFQYSNWRLSTVQHLIWKLEEYNTKRKQAELVPSF